MPGKRPESKTVLAEAPDLKPSSPEDLERLRGYGTPDRESPEWSEADFAAAAEARRRRIMERAGRVRKHRITINLDEDLLAYFKALGERGYQTRINDALRAFIAHDAAAGGNPRDLIEQAKAALERAERMMEQEDAA